MTTLKSKHSVSSDEDRHGIYLDDMLWVLLESTSAMTNISTTTAAEEDVAPATDIQ